MLDTLMTSAGAVAWGVARAEALSREEAEAYDRWLAEGRHGEMAYLERYADVRRDPRLLLEGARSVIVAAFPYSRPQPGCRVAAYALGADYHTALRTRLQSVVDHLESQGYKARVCVDTAPIRERLWAVRAGVGFIGRNGALIVPGIGSYVFLAEVITDAPLEPSEPCAGTCGGCGACVRACPGHALDGPLIDCRRCLSYLTIEYRGDTLPPHIPLAGRLYGCDTCQAVCPHNRPASPEPPASSEPPSTLVPQDTYGPPDPLPEFLPRPEILALTPDQVLSLTPSAYRRLTRDSAISRARLTMLQRNARNQ